MWGGGLEGAGPKTETVIQPQVCAGLFYRCNPAFRLGVEYSYTRMLREQTQANLLSLPDGGVKGDVYRDLKTNFHNLGVTVEANLLGHRSGKTPLSLYAGTGIGCLFAFGNTYTLGVSNSFKPGAIQTVLESQGTSLTSKIGLIETAVTNGFADEKTALALVQTALDALVALQA